MKYRLAIFDMDGTLLNTMNDIYACWSRALRICGIPPVDIADLRRFVGYSIEIVMDRTMPEDTTPEQKKRFLEEYVPYFKLHNNDTTKEFDGMSALLRDLRAHGILCAVVSNNSQAAASGLCEKHFPGLFDSIVGAEGLRAKPAPDTLNAALERLGVKREEAIFVGDGETDIQAAINADMDNVAALWGYRDRGVLEDAGARIFARDVSELRKIIFESK